MNRVGLFLILSLIIFSACREKEVDLQSSEAVCNQVDAYYGHLLSGRYEEYAVGISGSQSMLPEQLKQTKDALEMFCGIQEKQHGGIVKAKSSRAIMQGKRAEVYVDLTYADSTKECIVIPLVLEDDSVWRME